MKFFRAIVFFILISWGSAEAQHCQMYPNQQTILSEYGVKKITLYLEPYATGKKEVEAVYFLDSSGCAFKWLSRRFYSGGYTYYINEEHGSYRTGKKESYYAQLDKDSNEVLIERRIDHYTPRGGIWKEESWRPENGKIFKTTSFYGPHEPDTIDRKIFVTDEAGDTVRKIFTTSDPKGSFYVYWMKEDGKWREKQKWITQRNLDGRAEEYRRWENGKLVEGKKYETKKINENLTEVIETDLEGNPTQKTVYTSPKGDYAVYKFQDGKWVFQYEEFMPEGDPVDDGIKDEIIFEEPVNTEQKKGKEEPKKKAPVKRPVTEIKKRYKQLSKGPPVEKLSYRDPVKKDQVIMKELFTPEGLILETDVIWDRKKWIYEYEFFSE